MIKQYNKGSGTNPQFAEAWYARGVASANLGRYGEAITCYDKVIEINPQFAEAWYNKGEVLLKIGHVEEASEAFKKAHRKGPNIYKYLKGWITSLYEGEKLNECLKICEKGISFFKGKDDELKELFYQKGVILNEQGKTDDALIAFKEARGKGNNLAKEAISRIIKAKAGWWDWWFSDIMSETCFWKFIAFPTVLIILHLSGLLYYVYYLPIKSIWGILLVLLCSSPLIALLFISRKALLGVVLIEILIAMLILTLILLFSKEIPNESKEVFSKTWQIWIAFILVLTFALFHRIIERIKTPLGDIAMTKPKETPKIPMLKLSPPSPELKLTPEISMPEFKL